MSEDDFSPGSTGNERLFWQDGRWRPGLLIDWARWNPEADARQRQAEGRPSLSLAARAALPLGAAAKGDGGWRTMVAKLLGDAPSQQAASPSNVNALSASQFSLGRPPSSKVFVANRASQLFWDGATWVDGSAMHWPDWNPEEDAHQRRHAGFPPLNLKSRIWNIGELGDLRGGPSRQQIERAWSAVREQSTPEKYGTYLRYRMAMLRGDAMASVPAPPLTPYDGSHDALTPAGGQPSKWQRRWPWIRRGLWILTALLALTIAWLAFTAPLSRSLQPIVPPQMTILSAQGTEISRHGDIVDRPVDIAALPPHVVQAFLATEDRTFYSHIGISARGFGRALWTNVTTGRTQGGSTITQQLAKFTFLNADQTITRKAREALIALWMEVWLTKDEILGRYLSNAHFGGNVYGLRAASLHYFYRQPERLTLTQSAMLAGMLRAPNRYNPLRHLDRAQERERVVLGAMVDAGYLSEAQRRSVRMATTDNRARESLPSGTYFADWALPQAREGVDPGYEPVQVTTTLDDRMQRIARQATSGAALGQAQVALVAMRTNGEVVAMVGGRSYAQSPFNRATQARRQPGSTFKLVVYYAALQAGMTPDTPVDDNPITTGTYRPVNSGGRYRGQITLREAFARSSNVVAVRLYQELGSAAIQSAARDLGITAELPDNASVALGSASMTLLELTAAYASVAANQAPVEPHAIRRPDQNWFERLFDGRGPIGSSAQAQLLDMLRSTIEQGTGRAARLGVPAFGKTGTSQDNRDALFVGFAGDLVVGVWVGNDDNSPLRGVSGGGLPARIWRDFMAQAVPGAAPQRRPAPPPPTPDEGIFDDLPIPDTPAVRYDPQNGVTVDGSVGGLDVRIGRDGVDVQPGDDLQERIDNIRRRAEELDTQAVR